MSVSGNLAPRLSQGPREKAKQVDPKERAVEMRRSNGKKISREHALWDWWSKRNSR